MISSSALNKKWPRL